MRFQPLLFALLFSLTLAACTEKTAPSSARSSEDALPNLPEKPDTETAEVEIFAVLFDNFRIRSDSAMSGAVVTQVSQGQFVEGTGVVSSRRDTATLRGWYYEEPYVEVRTMGADPKTGFIFNAGVLSVFNGPRSKAPDLQQLAALANHLKTLPITDVNSGQKAWKFVESNFSNPNSTSTADAAFFLLNKFFESLEGRSNAYEITDPIQWTQAEEQAIWEARYDMNSRPETSRLAQNGFTMGAAEGMFFPRLDMARFNRFFSPKLSPATKAFLGANYLEFKNPTYYDGGILLEMPDFADRVLFWEQFNKTYPNFPQRTLTRSTQKWMSYEFLVGTDNSMAVDYETETLNPEFAKAWEYVLKKYPNSDMASHIRAVKRKIAQDGGKYTEQGRSLAAGLLGETYIPYVYD